MCTPTTQKKFLTWRAPGLLVIKCLACLTDCLVPKHVYKSEEVKSDTSKVIGFWLQIFANIQKLREIMEIFLNVWEEGEMVG